MGTSPLTLTSFLLIHCLTLSSFLPTSSSIQISLGGKGTGISIGIGIGGPSPSSPSSPSSSTPKPSDFPSCFLYKSYFVIQEFKKTITCDPQGITKTWNGTDICGTYCGFYCEAPPGYDNVTGLAVASVDFNGNALTSAQFDMFVHNLTELALFHANSNNFSGKLPILNGNQYFYELDLSNNKLAGSFPQNAIQPNLTFLDLRFNTYNGCVPPDVFGKLPFAIAIFLNNNMFSGDLPSNLGYSPVQYLSLANNKFTGPIPSSIGHAKNLLEVLFLNNTLSGCLPNEVGLLKKLVVFDASLNFITGPIPYSYGCLKNLEQLVLAHNLLYGEVPEVLCKLVYTGKLNLSLSYNYFTSLGPTCWTLIKQGNKRLDVRKNCIPWVPDQRSSEECWWFAKKPKTCPWSSYTPCWGQSSENTDSVSASDSEPVAAKMPVKGGASRLGRKSGYRTYGALDGSPVPRN
ncbi:hypothetical protein LUZ61_000154 [Rhynchospora tenuis]|uniref:Leucine-rich repeat-containing N-terminal plant-type domain-containing protein n=1 Tax=Rhynchospora tenuis TaxID=198213 RepID=A0AAD5ZEX4_9POAL|nr:hypothetical protein LUZ61_000154 [Rhynchospora tenuis]